MRGRLYTTDNRLTDDDLMELASELAIKMHKAMGPTVYSLERDEIARFIAEYIEDLEKEDQEALPWLIWDLFLEALNIELE